MSRPPMNDDSTDDAGHPGSPRSDADASPPPTGPDTTAARPTLDPEATAARPTPDSDATAARPTSERTMTPGDPSPPVSWPPPQARAPQQGPPLPGPQRSPGPGPGPWPPTGTYGPQPQEARSAPFRRGFGLGAGAGLGFAASALALALVGGLLSAIALLAAPPLSRAQASYEVLDTIWGAPNATHTLRAIPVTGMIMADPSDGAGLSVGTYGYEVARVIDRLDAEDADALVLLMDTPGGSITGSRAIADAVDRYRKRTGNPVFAHVQSMSASGGMYAMANADHIVADHGSLVGSIGVISGPFARIRDVTGTSGTLFEQGVTTEGGISYEYFSMGKDKDFGNPYRDMRPEEREVWTSFLSAEYDTFVTWVAEHRDIPAETIRNEYGAHVFGAETAVANGYVDAVGGRDEAFRDFATRAGVDPDDTQVVRSVPPGLLASLLGVEARPPGVAAAVEAQAGSPAHVTATMCTGTPQVLAVHGDLSAFCG